MQHHESSNALVVVVATVALSCAAWEFVFFQPSSGILGGLSTVFQFLNMYEQHCEW